MFMYFKLPANYDLRKTSTKLFNDPNNSYERRFVYLFIYLIAISVICIYTFSALERSNRLSNLENEEAWVFYVKV